MEYTKELTNLIIANSVKASLIFQEESCCPICKSKISPVYIASSLNTEKTATVFNHCRSCHNSFVTNYAITKSSKSLSSHIYYDSKLTSSEPFRYTKQKFDQTIINLSPQFDKIYNQALAAESSGLDEIAGLGYRKALEFLVKDFAIHLHPDKSAEIKSMPLSQCITNYVDAQNIKTLATRSAWIGNDEAHYIRKQEDRDVSDMKSFIQATVYFVGMILITEDAASMQSK